MTRVHAQDSDEPQPEAVPAQAPIPNAEPTVVEYAEYHDPLRPVNRAIFSFNDALSRYAIIPVGRAYTKVVPRALRKGIGNIFENIRTPVSAVNHLFQGHPTRAGKSLLRFGVNSTAGVGGIFDPASTNLDLAPDQTGFGDTLTVYGAGYGFYIVIPILGSSDLKNTTGLVADNFLSPITIYTDQPTTTAVHAFDSFQQIAPLGEDYLKLHEEAEDPYIFFRNLHLQGIQRNAEYPASE